MVDLTTTYMGLSLKNPVVPSASPLSASLDSVKRMEDAGAAAVTLHSLFEEQIEFEAEALGHFLERGTESFAEALTYFPAMDEYRREPDDYVEHIRQCKHRPFLGSTCYPYLRSRLPWPKRPLGLIWLRHSCWGSELRSYT